MSESANDMPSTDVALSTDKRPNRIDRLTPKVRRAIEIMVWDGKPYNEAAAEVGLTTRAMRLALDKPFVLAAMKRELQVLTQSERARDIRRLHEIRDAADNMPAINAIRTLIGMDSEGGSINPGASPSPGVTIRIINQAPASPPMIDVSPTIRHAADTRGQIDE